VSRLNETLQRFAPHRKKFKIITPALWEHMSHIHPQKKKPMQLQDFSLL
jgi:hypothetical protein